MTLQYEALAAILDRKEEAIIQEWLAEAARGDALHSAGAVSDARDILQALRTALQSAPPPAGHPQAGSAWHTLNGVLEALSRSRAARGETAGDTSLFVLALKKALFTQLQAVAHDTATLQAALWDSTALVDRMAQHTITTFQLAREDIIRRQQEELLELSTPVVKLWDGVLAVPMIGTLDSNRTQVVMETLLQRIVDTGSDIAIIDITGVPTVDTLVAQHLLKTVAAIRLMGADCIVSGIRPQIAQTIVHLGIDLQGIHTRATLADALALALQKSGWRIDRVRD
ncbi:STAS domain-containing protein [Paracidovorax avenae]|uniref:STAS domain-containing protein n=2 Tax=Paracidovorax avenae TaxID=80867 RepID=UPI000D15CD65|nr:STAS domain-containing protein [Paracidovorax avenae]AVS85014.1 polyvinylalcohol dehydrogenase [Paracidovorax avenae]AVS88515.1 polyvinylalcohol dehydrogenase [Paracidovorax avenae]AVS96022.1 polyvinylalcohol dehydrogenase [Paracidovorax avenae]AVT02720.1 polyvinylalcohol dehydrogenase [Paracidovorax avenae]AVT09549.1 polyvinylalcohol dehydrogenase [Paracidovorax avenae]